MTIFSLENLYHAYLDCRKNKRKTANALKFEYNLEENLIKLQEELESGSYSPGRSICFAVSEPTPREIFAADFRDRVVHHLLVREINEIGERNFIHDSFACRKNKGTHKAVKRLREFIRKASENGRNEVFYAQLDISGFFMSIDKDVLFEKFEKLAAKQNKTKKWKQEVLWLGKTIIFHNPAKNYAVKGDRKLLAEIPQRKSLFFAGYHKGLPIGNYSSQFFANLYFNDFDQFVKRKLKSKHYVRYADDFILLEKSKEKLRERKGEIENFLQNGLQLKLNEKKCKIRNIKEGIDFLGYFIKPGYVLARKRVAGIFKKKRDLVKIGAYAEKNENPEQKAKRIKKEASIINSYCGHAKLADAYNLRKNILGELIGERSEFCLAGDYGHLRIKRGG